MKNTLLMRDWSDFLAQMASLENPHPTQTAQRFTSYNIPIGLPSIAVKGKDESYKVSDFFSDEERKKTIDSFLPIILNFMVKDLGGWQPKTVALPGKEFSVKGLRALDPRLWEGVTLKFTDTSVNSLMVAYNMTASNPNNFTYKEKATVKYEPGDMLLGLICWRTVRQDKPFRHNGERYYYNRQDQNIKFPEGYKFILDSQNRHSNECDVMNLNPLIFFYEGLKIDPSMVQALFGAPMETFMNFMPWLGPWVVTNWKRTLTLHRWRNHEYFRLLNIGLGMWAQAWYDFALAKQREDLLIPLTDLFTQPVPEADGSFKEVAQMTDLLKEFKFADRTAARNEWHSWEGVKGKLFDQYARLHAIHPVDRTPAQKTFMEHIEETGFMALEDTWRKFENNLMNVIS